MTIQKGITKQIWLFWASLISTVISEFSGEAPKDFPTRLNVQVAVNKGNLLI